MITNIYKIANYNKLLDNFDYTEIAFLQRVAYWIGRCGKRVEGDNRLWIYNTLAEWAVQMRVSISKIQTTIKKFEKEMILISEKINASKGDQTKWYTINYNVLAKYTNDCFAANTLKPKTIRLKTTPKQQNNKTDKFKTKTLGENVINKKKEIVIEEIYIEEKKIAEKMVAEWNKEFDSSTHLYIGRVSNQSAPQLAKIWGKYFMGDMTRWKEYITIVRNNEYAMQQTDKFKGNFTWAIKDDTIVRMLKYNKPKIKVTNNTEITAKKIYPHKTSACGVKNQMYSSNNIITKQNNSYNCSYTEENLLFAKEIAEKMKKEWNEIFSYSNKPIKAYVSDKNAFRFAGLWRDVFDEDMDKWREYVRLVNSSSFLMGERTSFKANFSWLLETETVQKVMAREYNVGDRIIDEKNISKNLTSIQNEVVYEITETIKSKIKINDNEERKIFNDYILNRQFMYDPDPYQLKDLFNNTFLSPHSLIIDERWRQLYEKTYNSYLAKKHLGINCDDIGKMMKDLVAKSDKTEAELLKVFKDIRSKLKTYIYDLSFYNLPALFAF